MVREEDVLVLVEAEEGGEVVRAEPSLESKEQVGMEEQVRQQRRV